MTGDHEAKPIRCSIQTFKNELRPLIPSIPYNIHEDPGAPGLDDAQFAAWVKQASELPGERM
jgi:hypothetical protein